MNFPKCFLGILLQVLTLSILGATCDDGMMNGDERGIDCGGINCPPCLIETQPLIQNIYSHNQISFYGATPPVAFTTGKIETDLLGDRIIWSIYSSSAGVRKVYSATTDGIEFHEVHTVIGEGLFAPPLVDISPDGNYLLFTDGIGEIYVANFDGSGKTILVDEIENPSVPGELFDVVLRQAPQFGGSLASPLNVYFIHKDFGSNGSGQAAERAGLYFTPVDGTSPPTQIFSAKHVAELYGEDGSTYTPVEGLFGPKVSDGNLILFGTNDYGDGNGADLWTNLNTTFNLVTENASSAGVSSEMDISGDGNVVVWRDLQNDQYVIKDLGANSLKTYPRFEQFDVFGPAHLHTNYFGTNTLIRHTGSNNCVLIDAQGEVNFPLYNTKFASDSFDKVGTVNLAKSRDRFFFTSNDAIGNIFMTRYGNDSAPTSLHPQLSDFSFSPNWVVENEGTSTFQITTNNTAVDIEFVNFVELNSNLAPASILNNFSNHYLSNDGSTLGDELVDDIFTHNNVKEQSSLIPQVPDTFQVRITLFGETHHTSYDIYPFFLLNSPMTPVQNIEDTNFQVDLYPKVVEGHTTLRINSDKMMSLHLSLWNVSGQMIQQNQHLELQMGNNEFHLDINQLPSGLYFYFLQIPDGRKIIRFVKL